MDAVLARGTSEFAKRVSGHTLINMGTMPPGYSKALDADIRAMGGRYVEDGAPYPSTATAYPPISLAGLNWDQIVRTFTVPTAGPGQAILGAANHYIAAFCQLTGGKPGNVCSMSGVKAVTAGWLK